MPMIASMFSKPKIPLPPPPTPPVTKNSTLDAQTAALGRRAGLLAAMFGYRNPSGSSGSSTGQTTTGGTSRRQ